MPSLPRFIRLFAEHNDLTVVFLEDIVLLNQHAEALTLDTLGRLSASIAHELRNPLGAIRQAGQLLGEAPDLPDRHRKLIGIIDKHSQRLEHIVRGVLDLAKRERARPDVININTWLVNQVEEFRLTRLPEGDLLELDLATTTSEILFDPVHLDQVFGNLLGNAINYGRPVRGPLQITVRLAVSANEPPRLLIADNGSGIPPDKVELAFKPFYTTGKGGTGYSCSPLMRRRALLVTSTCRCGHADTSSATSGPPWERCSKLSSSSSMCCAPIACLMRSSIGTSGVSRISSTSATCESIRSGSRIGASGTR